MINTTLCYIEENGAYLMLHRTKKENDVNHDKWIGIGGKFEYGESPYDCVRREMYEETGLVPGILSYRGIVTFLAGEYYEQMHLFTAEGCTGVVHDCAEGTLEWVPKGAVNNLTLWEGDRIFLDLLEKKEPFFSLKLVYTDDRLTEAVLDGVPLPLPGTAV